MKLKPAPPTLAQAFVALMSDPVWSKREPMGDTSHIIGSLVGLWINVIPEVPMEELRTLVIFLYFGEMTTISRISRTCKTLKDIKYIWCQECWCYKFSPRRQQPLICPFLRFRPAEYDSMKHVIRRGVRITELATYPNWFCWRCHSSWFFLGGI